MKNKEFINSIVLREVIEKAAIFAFLFVFSNILYHFMFYGIDLLQTSKLNLVDLLLTYLITLISLICPLVFYFSSIVFLNIKLISLFTSYSGKLVLYQTLFLILGVVSIIAHKIIEAVHIEGIHISTVDSYFLYGSIWFFSVLSVRKFYSSYHK